VLMPSEALHPTMGWEAVIVGSFRFRESVSEEEMRLLICRIKDALELPIDVGSAGYGAFNEKIKDETYYFCHVNWSSHLDEERIKGLIREIGDKIEDYDITIYFLDEGVSFFRDSESGEDAMCEVG